MAKTAVKVGKCHQASHKLQINAKNASYSEFQHSFGLGSESLHTATYLYLCSQFPRRRHSRSSEK
jgi:hypothetical protein